MANELQIDQISTVLRAILKQATGRENLATLDTAQLLTIGQTALKADTEKMLNAMSQVWSRTLFSVRSYEAKFGKLKKTPEAWGNAVRKITLADKDKDLDDNAAVDLVEGRSVDQYEIDNVVPVQLNFYGQQTYTVVKTIYMTQLNTAFNSASEFAQFQAMVLTYVYNKIELIHENTARGTVAAAIAGIKAENNPKRVVHLLTEYNAATGLALTGETMMLPDNFEPFMRWVYARINKVSRWMTEYGALYQTQLTGKTVLRHTPKDKQMSYFLADMFEQMETRVMNTLIEKYMKIPGFDTVSFWQATDKPDEIHLTHANYLNTDGSITDGGDVTVTNVFGITFDVEAMGYTPVMQEALSSPVNAKGMYRNMFWHFWERHWVDFTEKMVIYLLD